MIQPKLTGIEPSVGLLVRQSSVQDSIVDSHRSFFFVAPRMCCLDIVWVVVAPGSAHSFWAPVVGGNVVIIGELCVADCTFSVLLNDLPVQELAHFAGRPKLAISSWMMRILDSLNSKSYQLGPWKQFAPTAGERSMDWAQLIATESHGAPLTRVSLETRDRSR